MHRLLKRQISKYLDQNSQSNLKDFLEAIDLAYRGYDEDYHHLENILEQSSIELFKSNKRLEGHLKSKTVEAQQANNKLMTLFENISEIIFQIDKEGRIEVVNPSWEEILDYPEETSKGEYLFHYLHPYYRRIFIEKLELIKKQKISTINEDLIFKTNAGEMKILQCRAQSIIHNNRLLGISGTLSDITDKIKAETELKKSHAFQKAILDSSNYAIISINHEG
ncbi:MAG: PAS domain S-box protein, partial [Bacteroidales bacterium]|nr:PAS domain S-box protein [Bacteroidales bacterium]